MKCFKLNTIYLNNIKKIPHTYYLPFQNCSFNLKKNNILTIYPSRTPVCVTQSLVVSVLSCWPLFFFVFFFFWSLYCLSHLELRLLITSLTFSNLLLSIIYISTAYVVCTVKSLRDRHLCVPRFTRYNFSRRKVLSYILKVCNFCPGTSVSSTNKDDSMI